MGQAEMVGVRRAARDAGIPTSTVESWRMRGEFAQLRNEKKEEVAADMWATVQIGMRRVAELLPLTDDVQKAATATAIVYDKLALMRGEATARTETREMTDTLSDHEKVALRESIDNWLKGPLTLEEGLALHRFATDALPVEPS